MPAFSYGKMQEKKRAIVFYDEEQKLTEMHTSTWPEKSKDNIQALRERNRDNFKHVMAR